MARMARPRRAPELVHAHETLEVPVGGALRLAVVADTHGRPHPTSHALVAAEKPDRILHAGDIGDLAVLDRLGEIAPVLAVRGNIDAHAPGLPDAMTIDVRDEGGPLVRLLLLHIAVDGPRLRADAARLAHGEGADVVVCGHSHVPFIGRDRGVVVHNPGSIGPRRFTLPIVFGVIDVSRDGVKMWHVSCEEHDAGQRWQPLALRG